MKQGAEAEWRAERCCPNSEEPKSQDSAFWDMINTRNRNLLVIVNLTNLCLCTYGYIYQCRWKLHLQLFRVALIKHWKEFFYLFVYIFFYFRIILQETFIICACWLCLSPLQSTSSFSSTRWEHNLEVHYTCDIHLLQVCQREILLFILFLQ